MRTATSPFGAGEWARATGRESHSHVQQNPRRQSHWVDPVAPRALISLHDHERLCPLQSDGRVRQTQKSVRLLKRQIGYSKSSVFLAVSVKGVRIVNP
jgi:hypothetical protein